VHLQWLVPTWVWPLLLLAAVGGAVWVRRVYRRTVPQPSPSTRRLLVVLRTAAVVIVLLAVARPLLVLDRDVREPAVVAVVLEDSGSMALRDRDDRPTRWRQAVGVAAAIDSTLAASGTGAEFVLLRGNGRDALEPTDLASARVDTPTAVGSDLPAIVTRTRQRLLTRSLRGIVVLSDGHSDAGRSEGRPGRTPLWLAGVGDPEGQADRRLADLRYPDAVHVGEPLLVDVAVRQQAAASGDSLRVRLRHEGRVVDERAGPAADLRRWELTWTPTEVGLAVLEVEVAALDNERFLANNRATLAVDVQKDRARVLLLGPTAGWDARFLAQAALAEPRLALETVRPGPDGPRLADSLAAWRPPTSAAGWREDWEAVVLAGPPTGLLADAGETLAAAVDEGLGLLVLAADAAAEQAPRRWTEPLRQVLPVEPEGPRLRPIDARLQIADGGRGHPVLADLDDGGGLAQLPPVRLISPARVRGGARPLLLAGTEPLLVAAPPSAGRVLWFGGRRLWELAFWQRPEGGAAGDHAGRRLLRQLLLWTALGDEAGGVTWLGRQLAFEEGQALPVAVRWRDLRGDPVTEHPVTVLVQRAEAGETEAGETEAGETEARHTLRPVAARPGEYAGTLPPLAPGRWRLVPRGEDDPPVVGAAREVVVTAAASELRQVSQDRRNLRQTAARLGGRALDVGDAGERAMLLGELGALDLGARRAVRQARLEPGATWPWLLVATLLLGAEWLVRRRAGLL
jgi:hypothetical protein